MPVGKTQDSYWNHMYTSKGITCTPHLEAVKPLSNRARVILEKEHIEKSISL